VIVKKPKLFTIYAFQIAARVHSKLLNPNIGRNKQNLRDSQSKIGSLSIERVSRFIWFA